MEVINISLNVPHYKQADSRWGNLILGSRGYTIGQIGCGLTCAAMLEKETPDVLYNDYNMTGELCDWTKLEKHEISLVNVKYSSRVEIFNRIFKSIVFDGLPIILYGDDGGGGIFSTHFVIAYRFNGLVGIDPDVGIIGAANKNDFSQFKVHDPSDVNNYGKHKDAESFDDRFSIVGLRIPSLI